MNICKIFSNFLWKQGIILKDDINIYTYGFFVFFYNSFLIVSILFIGLIFKHLEYSLFFLLFWTPYRILVGGSHCSTPIRCYIFFNLYYLLGYYIYLNVSLFLMVLINLLLLMVQLIFMKEKSFFYLMWLLYYILLIILPFDYKLIMTIAYFMNSLLAIHQIMFNSKYII
ncbi:MAG: accessory gene regulator B family protein [Massilimicrobiota timonensis]